MTTSGLAKIGLALCYLNSVETAILCFPKNRGLINSILLFVYSIGATILILVDTLYVNPENKSPDLCIDLGVVDEW
jgi:hypothetical protein